MIAVDTNILVYAHRRDLPQHAGARSSLAGLQQGARWAVPWPAVHEFLAVVTNPRIFAVPSTVAQATGAIADLVTAEVVLLGESSDHLSILTGLLVGSSVVGAKVHDARIAAICLGHQVEELWSADRDFSSFPQLRTRNPLITT